MSNPLSLRFARPRDMFPRLVQTSDGKFYDGMGAEITSPVSTPNIVSKYNKRLIGEIDGINTVFNTTHNYLSKTTRIYVQGLRQDLGVDGDYIESDDNEITFNFPPWVGAKIIIDFDIIAD